MRMVQLVILVLEIEFLQLYLLWESQSGGIAAGGKEVVQDCDNVIAGRNRSRDNTQSHGLQFDDVVFLCPLPRDQTRNLRGHICGIAAGGEEVLRDCDNMSVQRIRLRDILRRRGLQSDALIKFGMSEDKSRSRHNHTCAFYHSFRLSLQSPIHVRVS
jgi:hypothetical protein